MNGFRQHRFVDSDSGRPHTDACFEPAVDVVRLAQLVDLELLALQRGERVNAGRLLVPIWASTFAVEAVPGPVAARWCRADADDTIRAVHDARVQATAILLRSILLGEAGGYASLGELVGRTNRATTDFIVRALVLAAPMLDDDLEQLTPLLMSVARHHSVLLAPAVAACTATRASAEMANELLDTVLSRLPRTGHEPWLRDLVAGLEVGNPVPQAWFMEQDWWMLARLSTVLPPVANQLPLDFQQNTHDARDHAAELKRALFRTSKLPRLSMTTLLERMAQHPLRADALQMVRAQ